VQTAAGAKQTLGIGNSVMGPITGPAGKCADVAAAAVIAYHCHGGSNQQWRPDDQGRLLNTGSGKCLDTRNGATTDGTPLVIRTCSTAPTRRWTAPARGGSAAETCT
jgi:hypothetical protein